MYNQTANYNHNQPHPFPLPNKTTNPPTGAFKPSPHPMESFIKIQATAPRLDGTGVLKTEFITHTIAYNYKVGRWSVGYKGSGTVVMTLTSWIELHNHPPTYPHTPHHTTLLRTRLLPH